jgi:hypothetical protein
VTDSTNAGDIESIDSLLLDISTLRSATDNFAEGNRLGEGGFGAVYKVGHTPAQFIKHFQFRQLKVHTHAGCRS